MKIFMTIIGYFCQILYIVKRNTLLIITKPKVLVTISNGDNTKYKCSVIKDPVHYRYEINN